MRSKNHYKTLSVDAAASQNEIRKAYRQLALKYHPDKNNGDELSASQFKEIHEAYHVLSDPQRRSIYNQKRWFSKHALFKQAEPLTPFLLFTKSNELKLFLQKLRATEINKTALSSYVNHLLSKESISVLRQTTDSSTSREFIINLLKATEYLTALETDVIALKLKAIADTETMQLINQRKKEIRVQKIWEQYQFLIVIIITLFICLMIYVVANNS